MKIPLTIPPGLVGDDTDFSTPGYRDGSGIRFWRGKPQTVGGFESLSPTALTGVCRTAFCWSDGDSYLSFAFGQHNALTIWQSGEQAVVTPSSFVAGQIDGTGGAGYGTGAWDVGDYGEPSSTDYFPMTWSFGARNGELYANPRNQTIYRWQNIPANIAIPLTNAPAKVTSILCVYTGQIMALGCTDTGSSFNPSCIRISDTLDPTVWSISTANTAQQYYLEGSGRIVAGRAIGRYVFIWTDSELHLGTFTDSWNFERVDRGCGLAGPNAAIVVGERAYWVSPDLQFYSCALGGAPELLVSPVREEFKANAASSQNDKIVAASISEWAEVVWFYADARDGFEVSRAIRLSLVDGAWSKHDLARTAFVDSNPAPYPVGVTYAGQIYWHERGATADGAVLSASLRTGGQYMDPAQRVMLLRGVWPDLQDQTGAVSLTIYTKMYPQDTETTWGPYVMAANTNKVDFLATGRIFDFEFTSLSSPSSWRLGKPVFDAAVVGER